MKRKTSKEILAESFREVAEYKSIDKITVKDITGNCGYSPATFYRQFKDKYDLIAWDYKRELNEILSGMSVSKAEWEKSLIRASEYFNKRRKYLANLFLHTGGMESFTAYMQEINFQSLKSIVEKASGNRPVDAMTVMYIRVYVLGTVQFTCEWILGKIDITPAELVKVFEDTLPAPLQKYLY